MIVIINGSYINDHSQSTTSASNDTRLIIKKNTDISDLEQKITSNNQLIHTLEQQVMHEDTKRQNTENKYNKLDNESIKIQFFLNNPDLNDRNEKNRYLEANITALKIKHKDLLMQYEKLLKQNNLDKEEVYSKLVNRTYIDQESGFKYKTKIPAIFQYNDLQNQYFQELKQIVNEPEDMPIDSDETLQKFENINLNLNNKEISNQTIEQKEFNELKSKLENQYDSIEKLENKLTKDIKATNFYKQLIQEKQNEINSFNFKPIQHLLRDEDALDLLDQTETLIALKEELILKNRNLKDLLGISDQKKKAAANNESFYKSLEEEDFENSSLQQSEINSKNQYSLHSSYYQTNYIDIRNDNTSACECNKNKCIIF